MIWSDKANANTVLRKKGAYVMTNEEAESYHTDMCWDGSDWSEADIAENNVWMKETQRILNQSK